MSSKIKVLVHVDAPLIASSEANLAAAKVISNPLIITMSASETKSLIGIGPQRTAEMEAIYINLLKPFPEVMSKDYTLADFDSIRTEIHNTKALKALHQTQANVYGTHVKVLQHNYFQMCIDAMNNGRLLMKTVPGIATAVNTVSNEFLVHANTSASTSYSIALSTKIEVTNLVSGKRFVNDGTTILTILVKGGNAADTITIYPADSTLTPAGWINIVVTNLSATTNGSFQVFIK